MGRNVNFARGSPTSAAATGTQTNWIQQILTSATSLKEKSRRNIGIQGQLIIGQWQFGHMGSSGQDEDEFAGKNLPDKKNKAVTEC